MFSMYEKSVLPAVAAYGNYRGDDECAHELTLGLIRLFSRVPTLATQLRYTTEAISAASPRKVMGLTFPAPILLAAGLDKDGVGLPVWEAVGFGGAEIGTITPYYQPGNDRQRLFRIDGRGELINRMGFNSAGMLAAGTNIAHGKRRVRIPVGISYGKMKDTPNSEAYLDYGAVLRHTIRLADYGVVNVSSPNTAGLRDMQARAYLTHLLSYLLGEAHAEAARQDVLEPPLLVKVAPDLTDEEFEVVVEVVRETGIAGIVIGNTTVSRPEGVDEPLYKEIGGLSGPLLFARALELTTRARALAPHLVLIMVGGINSAERAIKALHVADLIQVLTGFVFHGPRLVREIRGVRVPHRHWLTQTLAA